MNPLPAEKQMISQPLSRRRMFQLAGTALLCSSPLVMRVARAQRFEGAANLLSDPIEVTGDWGKSLPASALAVITRMRDVCLSGVSLVSDRQPERIRVDSHQSGPPSIWLHFDRTRIAWIIVDVGERDWSRLAYQFGHELGHVLCNSWSAPANGDGPCRWLEEAMVEAFSLRGLGLLATSWEQNPPFPGDNAFGGAIRQYRQTTIANYAKAADPTSYKDLADWYRRRRPAIESNHGLGPTEAPGILAILDELERDDRCVVDMGALNRWPERGNLPLDVYLSRWQSSCAKLGAPGVLPKRLRTLLGLGKPALYPAR